MARVRSLTIAVRRRGQYRCPVEERRGSLRQVARSPACLLAGCADRGGVGLGGECAERWGDHFTVRLLHVREQVAGEGTRQRWCPFALEGPLQGLEQTRLLVADDQPNPVQAALLQRGEGSRADCVTEPGSTDVGARVSVA